MIQHITQTGLKKLPTPYFKNVVVLVDRKIHNPLYVQIWERLGRLPGQGYNLKIGPYFYRFIRSVKKPS